MHSYKEPEVVVKCLDIIKYHIGYVKVWNEAGRGLGLRLLFRYVYVYVRHGATFAGTKFILLGDSWLDINPICTCLSSLDLTITYKARDHTQVGTLAGQASEHVAYLD